jgi:hypothetical protein
VHDAGLWLGELPAGGLLASVVASAGGGQADPDVVAGLRRAAGPFLSDSSTMSPGRFAERLS